jgi:hypothetical protein
VDLGRPSRLKIESTGWCRTYRTFRELAAMRQASLSVL